MELYSDRICACHTRNFSVLSFSERERERERGRDRVAEREGELFDVEEDAPRDMAAAAMHCLDATMEARGSDTISQIMEVLP
jgi:hypothetical protein